MHRYRFVLTRPLQFLPVLFGISIITFVLVRMIPGDPARLLLGTRATPAAIARIRAQYGLDEPIWLQYFYFIKNVFAGEMGKSLVYKTDVLKLIATRIEPTVHPDRHADGHARRAAPGIGGGSRRAARLDPRARHAVLLDRDHADDRVQREARPAARVGLR
jgi:hypothetical protein